MDPRLTPTEPAPPHRFAVSPRGRAFIEREEGEILYVYKDPLGLPTCGVGHLLRPGDGVHPAPIGTPITAEVCDRLLASDLATVESAIHRYIRVPLTQPQFDALASWAFNCGAGVLSTSTLAARLNAGAYSDVPSLLIAWCHAGAAVAPYLLARRRREVALWGSAGLTPTVEAVEATRAESAAHDPYAAWSLAELAESASALGQSLTVAGLELHEGFERDEEPSA